MARRAVRDVGGPALARGRGLTGKSLSALFATSAPDGSGTVRATPPLARWIDDQLGRAGDGRLPELEGASVQHPEVVGGIDQHRLHGKERTLPAARSPHGSAPRSDRRSPGHSPDLGDRERDARRRAAGRRRTGAPAADRDPRRLVAHRARPRAGGPPVPRVAPAVPLCVGLGQRDERGAWRQGAAATRAAAALVMGLSCPQESSSRRANAPSVASRAAYPSRASNCTRRPSGIPSASCMALE